MERDVHLAALRARTDHDTFDQAPQSLGSFNPVLRAVQSLGQMGDLLGIELRGARQDVRGICRGFGEQIGELRLARFQRVHCGNHRPLEHALLDRFDHSLNLLLDLRQFGTPGVAAGAPLTVQPVGLLGIGTHGLRNHLRRQQSVLEALQHTLFELAPHQCSAVRTGPVADMRRADEAVGATQRAGAITQAAENQSREQRLWTSGAIDPPVRMMIANGHCHVDIFVGDLALLCLHRLPEFVIDNTQLWDGGDDPFGRRIEAGDTLAGRRILDIVQAIPDEPSQVELVVDDAGAALEMTPYRRVAPQLGFRANDAFGVQPHRDSAWADAGGEIAKDAPDHIGLSRIDLSVAPNTIAALIQLLDHAVSVTDPAAGLSALNPTPQTAMRLRSEVLQEQSIHRALQANVKLGYFSFSQRDDRHAGEAQLLEQRCHVRLIAADAVECLGEHDVERAALRVLEQ